MKSILTIKNINVVYKCVLITTVFLLLSCDKGFENLNKDPNKTTELIPEYLFTQAQLSAIGLDYKGEGYRNANQVMSGWMQQYANCIVVSGGGDKYTEENGFNNFSAAYPGPVNDIETLIRELSDPEEINKLSIARIWRVWVYHRITDLFGDIPYSEATKGATDKLYTPKYDEQSFIYMDMLKELDEAANAFDLSLPSFDQADLIYGGEISKWKKFAYSMMLRLGMRLTKVDNAAAKLWVQKAIAGGVIVNDEDVAFVQYLDGSQITSRNPVAFQLLAGNYSNQQDPYNREGGKIAHKIINHLQVTKDPRLNILAVVMVEQPTGGYFADTTAALQKGLLNGAHSTVPDDFVTYSEPNPNTVLKYESPMLVLTNCDMNLNLAEAALRGWYPGDAKTAYEDAVRAGMKQWALWGNYGVISDERIAAYLAYNPYNENGSFEAQLEQIQTQRWVSAMFTDEWEIFANWRRTGYPELVPVNYPGNLTGGTIPRRFIVPYDEERLNGENFLDAKARQGGNNSYTARVWWDVAE
ncbi:SusD/RagB family nutrient-binding outer membrane lipoprotein [Parapedobacter lycopersici]|uniref:SusD/RagB family nutrient-binding outer membrane lipoprotein n=1 Tax=Parapedobacter lycopersici TaxID=1864939 RepID=UPI00214D8304|nr:SusD/RagB family nutrient-binding outer membrane lipoprotein [Parapedobacter lycopersici]